MPRRLTDLRSGAVAAVAVENTHMPGGGTPQPIERLRTLRRIAREAGTDVDDAGVEHAVETLCAILDRAKPASSRSVAAAASP